jgi:cell wall-associated NlpC family hydrolase
MPDRHAVASRRTYRRRHASPWLGARAWLDLVPFNPRRTPLHVLVLSAGLSVGAIGALVHTPSSGPTSVAVAPATDGASSIEADASAPLDLAPAVAAAPQAVEAAPNLITYVVEPGDTLRKLADRFEINVATLVAANKLADPDLLRVGQELVVPPTNGILHSLTPGETLGQVASRYGVDPVKIATVNRVEAVADELLAGQKLVVPDVEPAIPEAKPKTAVARTESGSSNTEPTTSLASLTVTSDDAEKSVTNAAEVVEKSTEPAEKPAARSKAPVIYEVQEGDNIRSLANQFGVSIQTILNANDLADPDLIKVGTELKVLPVSGVEHQVAKGESLADIAAAYKVDMGPIIDFNGLNDPDVIRAGDKVLIPGATAKVTTASVAPAAAAKPDPAPASQASIAPSTASAPAAAAASQPAAKQPSVAVAAPAAPAIAVPVSVVGAGGAGVLKNAMNYVGYRYVFGGSSPSGFDCSGFVWYVHKAAGVTISRGLWGQFNGGQRIARENLQPGDTVFFANTYMPGLSHVGIYAGGGRFVHAIDESRGVGYSNLSDAYWTSRYIGAARLY